MGHTWLAIREGPARFNHIISQEVVPQMADMVKQNRAIEKAVNEGKRVHVNPKELVSPKD